ncbi:unnamed protein product [Absidia cylindrospora]
MDDIVSAAPLTLDDQKKRHSDDSERMSSANSPAPSQRSASIKQLKTTTSVTSNLKVGDTIDNQHLSATSWTDKPQRQGHHRTTSSTQNGVQLQYPHHQPSSAKKANKFHGRRGSLPPVLKLQPHQLQQQQTTGLNSGNKLSGVDFPPYQDHHLLLLRYLRYQKRGPFLFTSTIQQNPIFWAAI